MASIEAISSGSGSSLILAQVDRLTSITTTAGSTLILTSTASVESLQASLAQLNFGVSSADKMNLTATALLPTTTGGLTLGSATTGGWGGLFFKDTSAAFTMRITATSNPALTANRILTINVNNSARTIALQGNPTLADWFDQNVKTTGFPTFGGLTITDGVTPGSITNTGFTFTGAGVIASAGVFGANEIAVGSTPPSQAPFAFGETSSISGFAQGMNIQYTLDSNMGGVVPYGIFGRLNIATGFNNSAGALIATGVQFDVAGTSATVVTSTISQMNGFITGVDVTVPATSATVTDVNGLIITSLAYRGTTAPTRSTGISLDYTPNATTNWGWRSATDCQLSGTAKLLFGGTSTTKVLDGFVSGGSNTIIVGLNNVTEYTFAPTVFTLADANDIAVGTTTGTKIGTATSQKLGFWNVAPIIQPAAALQAALTNSTGGSQDGTLVDVATVGVADPAKINSNFTDVYALLDAMRTAMVNSGLMKGAA